MNTQRKGQGGFTIIEVVLVLAIAGLIFLMVFIALPALQRSQRDTQRRDDVSRAVSQLQSFATNNRGALPDSSEEFSDFLDNYLQSGDGEFNDPETGQPYTPIFGVGGEPNTGQIQYAPGRECEGEDIDTTPVGGRQAAVRMQLESGGFFCQNVQG